MSAGRVVVALAVPALAIVLWRVVPALRTTAGGVRDDVPAPYTRRVNPRAADTHAVAAGAELFRENCASCHGEWADGHGPAARGLTPPPADLRGSRVIPEHTDAYLFYRVSEGKPGTAMPAFRGALDEAERWALVSYLRSLPAQHAAR